MQKFCLVIGFSILLLSCKKNDSFVDPYCNNSTESIIGHWSLVAERSYSIPVNPDPNWQSVDKSNIVTVEFSNDSTFSYNSNYYFAMDNYDRFTIIDSVDFRIYSTSPPDSGNFPFYPSVFVKMITANELELTYMGIDAGEQEKYTYSCSK